MLFSRNKRPALADGTGMSVIYHANVKLLPGTTEASFLKMRPKLLAIPRVELLRINLDLTSMINAAQATSDKVLPLRDELIQLPFFDIAHVDELDDSAMALDFIQGNHQAISHLDDGLESVNLEATQTRARMVQDLRNLASHGLIDRGPLDSIVGTTGFTAVISDVRLCVHLYERQWSSIEGKTCWTPKDVERAAKVIHYMTGLVGMRMTRRSSENEWTDLRVRAFTLLFKHYGQTRRAVLFLRYEQGDADKFAPSLFSCRPKRRRGKEEGNQPEPPTGDVQPPVIGPNGPFVEADVQQTPGL